MQTKKTGDGIQAFINLKNDSSTKHIIKFSHKCAFVKEVAHKHKTNEKINKHSAQIKL